MENRIIESLAGFRIFAHILGARAFFLELRNVRTGCKGFTTGAAHDKKPRFRIGRHAVHLGRTGLIHGQRNGVMPLGVVDHHMPDTVDNAGE